MTLKPRMSNCAGTNFTNLIYTKLSTFPSRKISQIIHPVPFLTQGIRRKVSLSGLRTTGGIHPFSTPSNKIANHNRITIHCGVVSFFNRKSSIVNFPPLLGLLDYLSASTSFL
jgi:hypothetical protein